MGTSPINVARTSNMGFDGQIGYQDRFGEFNFNTNFVFSYAKNKVEFNAEAQQRYDWLSATGRPIGQPFGYTCLLYTSFQYSITQQGNEAYDKYGDVSSQTNSYRSVSTYQYMYGKMYVDWERQFGMHGVKASLWGDTRTILNNYDLPMIPSNIGQKVEYLSLIHISIKPKLRI